MKIASKVPGIKKSTTGNPVFRQAASAKYGSAVGRPASPQNVLKGSGKSIGQMKYSAVRNKIPQAYVGVRSFPGIAKGVAGVGDGTKGRFVQSTKGMRGKHYIDKALTMTMNMYLGDQE